LRKTIIKGSKPMKTITNITYLALTLFALACFSLSPTAQAVSPPPDGGYTNENTAEGDSALFSLTTGTHNTADGFQALFSNTTGTANTANGHNALGSNTTGSQNTANGGGVLASNTTGSSNTATGHHALTSNTTGNNNTAHGADALASNTTGFYNTAVGFFSLRSNVLGGLNTGVGAGALLVNTATANTAIGAATLLINTAGQQNTAIGTSALGSNTTGNANVALGQLAGVNATTGSNNVYIGTGMSGVAGESNACYIASIFGQTSANGVPVFINSNNQLGTTTSSKRFKEDIKPIDKASEALFLLKPVSFRYKKELDPAGTSQLGLVAEDVEKVNSDLVVRDKGGKPYSVRYDQVNAMLLNEFLKEHKAFVEEQLKVQEQGATIARQQKQIEALTAGLQKVSAQLEASKPAPQVAARNQ
jgi:hypothetical protein